MNEHEWLGALADSPAAPEKIDVTDWVLRDIRHLPPPAQAWPLGAMAALSVVAAIFAVVAAAGALAGFNDPLGHLISSTLLVIQ